MIRLLLCAHSVRALVLVAATAAATSEPEPGELSTAASDGSHGAGVSCGAISLAALTRLEGRPIALDEINSRLSRKSAHSLLELRDAARRSGTVLRCVHIGMNDWPLDRPALVHLDRRGVGHFVVIRPVGHSGKLVQILDPASGVEVVDALQLFSSPEWTGAGLVPLRFTEGFVARKTMFVSIFILTFGVLFVLGRIGGMLGKRRVIACG